MKGIIAQFTPYHSRYNGNTGIFTVPPGGAGLFYLSTYLLVDDGEKGVFDMLVNGNKVCTAYADHNDGGDWDYAQAACSGLAWLKEGTKNFSLSC